MLLQLNTDSQEILVEDYKVNLFLETVDEALRNREYTDFNDGLNKLSLYKSFCKVIAFKNHLVLAGGRGSGYTMDV